MAGRRRLSLHAKTIVLLATATVVLAVALAMPLRALYLHGFLELETHVATGHLGRVRAAFENEIAAMRHSAFDYGVWDETYAFAARPDPAFTAVNFVDETFLNHRLSAALLLAPDGRVLFAKGFDRTTRAPADVDPELLAPDPAGPLLRPGPEGVAGFLATKRGLWLVAAQPILTSTHGGPSRGTLLMARALDRPEIARLSQDLRTELSLARFVPEGGAPTEVDRVRVLDDRRLEAEAVFDDVRGQPVAVARLELPREVYARGLVGARLLLASTVAAGVFFGLVVVLLLERLVLRRVVRLIRDVRRVASRADLSLRVGVEGEDELGELGMNVNGMLDSLERLTRMLDRARATLREAFGRYLSEEVAQAVLASPEGARLGGEQREVTILFSDLRGYSTVSEELAPAEVVSLLNEYFGAMSRVIDRNGGCVIEFLGDAILAVFGAPNTLPDHAGRAVQAALAMREATDELNRGWRASGRAVHWTSKGIPALEARIGLHTGRVVAGNLGSDTRMKYAVVGDVVNTASRVEGLNKELGTDVLLTAAVHEQLPPALQRRWVDAGEHKVKGKGHAVRVFRLAAAGAATGA